MIEIVGVLCLTAIPVVVTLWFLGMLFIQWGFAEFRWLTWSEWVFVVIFTALIIFGWWVWWTYVASAITISIGVSA